MLFTKNGIPCQALKEVLLLTDIEHDGTVHDIVKKTQATWIRKPGTERWHISKELHKKHAELWQAFKELNLIDEIKPQQKEYNYVLFMGATISRMKKRFDYLVKLWEQGLRFKKLVILSGSRPLDEAVQERAQVQSICGDVPGIETEFDAACCIVDLKKFGTDDLPEVIALNAPMKEDVVTGKQIRPTTDDTIMLLRSSGTKPGDCLVISNQPHGLRQLKVVESLLSDDWHIDVASEACNPKEVDGVILDELARFIYQEHKLFFEQK